MLKDCIRWVSSSLKAHPNNIKAHHSSNNSIKAHPSSNSNTRAHRSSNTKILELRQEEALQLEQLLAAQCLASREAKLPGSVLVVLKTQEISVRTVAGNGLRAKDGPALAAQVTRETSVKAAAISDRNDR